MTELPDLSALIAIVDGRSDPGNTLERITVAEELTADLRALGDRLVGYYIELARAEGYSWSDIGAHLGVSRQAAQQRYTPRWSSLTMADLTQAGAFARLTKRANEVLVRSEKHARRLRHDSVGSEHLLLAILDDPASLAVKALIAEGAEPTDLRTATEERVPAGDAPSPAAVPVSPAARRALEASLKEALELGHNYIGTEHMLLGLLHDAHSGAGRLLSEAGVTHHTARATIQEILSGYLRRNA
jgi:hypothetical protein